ncbi:MAG: hypothetical protein QXS02_03685 [Candidatus Thermoplasmatota archaeon]
MMDKRKLMLLCLAGGIMLFFIGIAAYIALGPSTADYLLPRQVSAVIKLTGMGIVCICMIVGGIFVERLDKDVKNLLVIFGVILLFLNIFIFSYAK